MNKYQKRNVKNKKELTKDMLLKYQTEGLVTGSYVFGGWIKDESDVDIVLVKREHLFKELNDYIIDADGSVDDNTTFGAFYGYYKNLFINFIIMDEQENFDAWNMAHQILMSMKKSSTQFNTLLKDKNFRVKQFQLLRETCGWKYHNTSGLLF